MSLKTWVAQEKLYAADLNNNFSEVGRAITTYITKPMYGVSSWGNSEVGPNTKGYAGMFYLPNRITVNQFHLLVSNYFSGSGTIKAAIFSEDGQTRHISVETGSIASSSDLGLKTLTVGSVLLLPGNYYVVFIATNTLSAQVTGAGNNLTGFNNPSGKKVNSGEITVTANTMPSTFTPTSMTPASAAPIFRLDN